MQNAILKPIKYIALCPCCSESVEIQPNRTRSRFDYYAENGNEKECFSYELCQNCADLMRTCFLKLLERLRKKNSMHSLKDIIDIEKAKTGNLPE